MEKLLARAIQGDSEAFIDLILLYQSVIDDIVRQSAAHSLGDEVETLRDRIIPRLYERLASFTQSGLSFEDWLRQRASELCQSLALDALLDRARNGDRQAFGKLIITYQPIISVIARKYLRALPGWEEEEIFQETAFRALQNIHKFEKNAAALKAWIGTIAKNVCHELCRKQHPRLRGMPLIFIEMTDFVGQLVRSEQNPYEELIAREDAECAAWAYSSLAEIYQDVLRAKYQDKLKYEAIARQFGIPVGTVSKRLYKAKEYFMTLYRECEKHGKGMRDR